MEDAARVLNIAPDVLTPEARQAAREVPFTREQLEAAREAGEFLIFRFARDGESSLTIQRLIDRFPSAFEPRSLNKVGYSLRDEWGITLEPLATKEACTWGWFLVRKAPLPATCNLSYYEQDDFLSTMGVGRGRRRTAVEATFDTVLYQACGGSKLLSSAFDWTSSRTVDGGYLYVGGFGDQGMSLAGFSAAVRHDALGVCLTRGAA